MATLTIGLRNESRTKMRIAGQRITLDQMLMALIFDDLNLILWRGSKRRSKPQSLYKLLTEKKAEKDELKCFDTPEEYEEWMTRIKEGAKNG